MIFSILLLIILIVINGIFSASELAFLSIDKVELKREINKGNKRAIKINALLQDSSTFLSTIQIGITLAGFLASAFAADYFADYLLGVINLDFLTPEVLRGVLVVIITIILSYFTLVFGELVPKRLAINAPFKIASASVNLINFVKFVFYPLIKLLTLSTNLICKIFKIKENDEKLTEEDIKKMIMLGKDEGIIEEKEKEYILNVFEFNDVDVEKVMTPKKDICFLNIDDDFKKNMSIIRNEKFSRFPVYRKTKDNVVGVLNVKDLIIHHAENKDLTTIKDIIRPVGKYKHSDKIDDVFREMQIKNESLATVFKAKKIVGIVTIEDAVEEIVGNIYDEYDIED